MSEAPQNLAEAITRVDPGGAIIMNSTFFSVLQPQSTSPEPTASKPQMPTMTVADLIEKLKSYDPSMPVLFRYEDTGWYLDPTDLDMTEMQVKASAHQLGNSTQYEPDTQGPIRALLID